MYRPIGLVPGRTEFGSARLPMAQYCRTPECKGKAERNDESYSQQHGSCNVCTGKICQLETLSGLVLGKRRHISETDCRVTQSIMRSRLYHCWYGNSLQKKDLKLPKPFGCIVWDNVPKDGNREKHRCNKLLDHGTKGCIIGYVSASSTYCHIATPSHDFSRKTILQSHNLTFMETEFPARVIRFW